MKKLKLKKLLILFSVLLIIMAVILVLFFTRKGKNSPEAVVKEYVSALDSHDADMLYKLIPEELKSEEEFAEVSASMEKLNQYDMKAANVEIKKKTKLSDERIKEIQNNLKEEQDIKLSIKEAYSINYSYDMTMTYDGTEFSDKSEQSVVVIRVGMSWYLYE